MPIGAVVVVGDDVVATAHTQERTQRRLLVHAELLTLAPRTGCLVIGVPEPVST